MWLVGVFVVCGVFIVIDIVCEIDGCVGFESFEECLF